MSVSRPTFSVLLYGDSGAGKTTGIGTLAKWLAKAHGLRTRLYSADGGRWPSIQHFVTDGIVEVIDCHLRPKPWVWLDAISKGKVLADDGKTWVLDEARNALFGCYAFDGLTGYGKALMANMRDVNEPAVGGGLGMVVRQGDYTWGTNTQAHYGLAQAALQDAISNSQGLPGISVWTALAKRAGDADTLATILGPDGPGKAMTSDLPRCFGYTFRIVQLLQGNAPVHRLYWDDFNDPTAPGAKCLGNSRLPLGAVLAQPYVEPADVAEAIRILDEAREKAAQQEHLELASVVAGLPPLPPLPKAPVPRVVVPGRTATPIVVGVKK